MRKAVQNEVKASNEDSTHYLFRGIKTTPQGSTTRLYVETKEATAGLVIAYNGKPLTPEQRQSEQARVKRFIDNPEELKKKRELEHEYAERTLRIMRAMPDAFLFEYAGQEQGREGVGRAGDALVKLNFRPNPNYQPPSHVEEVLTGMQGYVLLDSARYRIASIDGTLVKEVSFGWGILGHLDRGGRFMVQQQEVGDNLLGNFKHDLEIHRENFAGEKSQHQLDGSFQRLQASAFKPHIRPGPGTAEKGRIFVSGKPRCLQTRI